MTIDNATEGEIIARYLRKGVIWQMPAKPAQRELLLRWLVKRIPLDQVLSETEINGYLGGHSVDHVTLRRYLVDAGLIARDRSGYWRVAGLAPESSERPAPESPANERPS